MCLGPTSGTAEEDSELPRHTFLSAPLAQVFTSVQIVLCKIQIFSCFRKSIFCESVVVFYFHLSAPRIRLPPLQTDRNLYSRLVSFFSFYSSSERVEPAWAEHPSVSQRL